MKTLNKQDTGQLDVVRIYEDTDTWQLQARLVICEYECSAEEITEILGIQPTYTIKKGSVRLPASEDGTRPEILHEENIWGLSSSLGLECDAEEHIEHLLSQVRHKSKELAQLGKKYYLELAVFGDVYFFHVGTHVNKKLMREIGQLNAHLDIDIYAWDNPNLDTEKKLRKLTHSLDRASSVKLLNVPGQRESRAIANALAKVEKLAPELSVWVEDFWFLDMTDDERQKQIDALVGHMHELQAAINASRLLSLTRLKK